jgi:hypothetical protein
MDTLTALALITGVLIAIWTFLSIAILPDLLPWVGLATWACFFAAGGKTQGFQKTVFASLSGLVYVWVMMLLLPRFGGGTLVYAILLGAIAVLMVVQSKVPPLSFIPGAFIGAAVTVGSGGGADLSHLLYVGLSLVAGPALGFASETVAGSLATKKQ